jgi:hypothetical protein
MKDGSDLLEFCRKCGHAWINVEEHRDDSTVPVMGIKDREISLKVKGKAPLMNSHHLW